MTLRMHHFLPCSRANGPGLRAVIWVQGCSLGCPGCFNPETHALAGGQRVSLEDLWARIKGMEDSIEGITLSGGEPLQQRAAVTELLRWIKSETSLSIILFSGFTWQEIRSMGEKENPRRRIPQTVPQESSRRRTAEAHAWPAGSRSLPRPAPAFEFRDGLPELLRSVDVLIAGRYDRKQRLASGLRGSANKTVHLLSPRYTLEDLGAVPPAELIINAAGDVCLSGINPLQW